MRLKINRSTWGWAFYDWANSSFATTLVAVFFPIFFKNHWVKGLSTTESTFYLGNTLSFTALVFAILAPFLGSLADKGGFAKKGVGLLTISGSACCLLFYWIPQGQWFWALLVYGLAWLSFSGANLFYDSILVHITKDHHRISCLGYGLGYLGGGVLIVINSIMVIRPELFGFENAIDAIRWVFVSVGLWWFLFTLPFWSWVPPDPSKMEKRKTGLFSSFEEVISTLKKIQKHKNLFLFLLAYFFYIDGVNTIYKMAGDFALSIQLDSHALIKAVIIVQFVGFPATLLFGSLTQKIGAKSGILFGIVIYCLICFMGIFISTATHFYILAFVLGLVQGGVQALSRSLYSRLIPPENSAEFFGFYNMFGKFSSIFGPSLMGLTSLLTNNPRFSLIGVLILFVIGGFLLNRVKYPKSLDAR